MQDWVFRLGVGLISHHMKILNTHSLINYYLTDSYISFNLKLESQQNFCSIRFIRSSTYGKKIIFQNSSMRKPFSCNSSYWLVLRKITISVIKMSILLHGGKSEIYILPYVLDLMDLLEQKFCRDSNYRVNWCMNQLIKTY